MAELRQPVGCCQAGRAGGGVRWQFDAQAAVRGGFSLGAAWTISEQGEVTDNQVDRPLDSSFPAATAAINLLAHATDDETLLHKLSPRRWGIAWRLDDPNVVLAEAQPNRFAP